MQETGSITRDVFATACAVLPSQPPRHVVFYGTGKQAGNILLCIRKQLDSAEHMSEMEFLGVGCGDATQQRFDERLRQLFPLARHIQAASSRRHTPLHGRPAIGFVVSPPATHEAGLQWMLEHGVERIVVEKPIASDRAGLEGVGEMLRAHPERICVQEQYLYSRTYFELLELLRNPAAYIAQRTRQPLRKQLTVVGTFSQFFKRRVKDLTLNRHAENICLLELPHILTLLYNAFGPQTVAALTVDDLAYRSRIYRGYRSASIVFSDRSKQPHQVELSNVLPCKRVMNVRLSDGYNVELAFPGRLRHDSTVFESRVTITRGRERLFSETHVDDHLATAVRQYLRWKGILGTYDSCYEPSRMVIELAGAQP